MKTLQTILTRLSLLLVGVLGIASISVAQSACESYRYFLANNSGGNGDLYELFLDDNDSSADMNLLASLDYPFHIAYDASGQLVYIVRID